MEHILLYTNQIRENGAKINIIRNKYNEAPKFDMDSIEEGIFVSIKFGGTISYFTMRYPAEE